MEILSHCQTGGEEIEPRIQPLEAKGTHHSNRSGIRLLYRQA